jgi:tetraacyldisaccharide-1-P 4'-kinase
VPEGFHAMLAKNDILYKKTIVFDDHHTYSQADIAAIHEKAAGRVVVTTEKDWVKIMPLVGKNNRLRWFVARVVFAPKPDIIQNCLD